MLCFFCVFEFCRISAFFVLIFTLFASLQKVKKISLLIIHGFRSDSGERPSITGVLVTGYSKKYSPLRTRWYVLHGFISNKIIIIAIDNTPNIKDTKWILIISMSINKKSLCYTHLTQIFIGGLYLYRSVQIILSSFAPDNSLHYYRCK